ncbi:MAG: radical SAM protein [Proteobacteria bacterium]|nr:radical SAM protein [Pseudomonadota bacterium]
MSRLFDRNYTYFSTVRGMCRQCKKIIPARIVFKDNKVWQQRLCHTCGTDDSALIAGDVNWYLERISEPRHDHSPLISSGNEKSSRKGCPHDCGPCSWHATPCQLPVISVTNACNLRCPICFTYNRSDKIYNISLEEMRHRVDNVIEQSGECDLFNITGGEPTLHPDIFDIIRICKRPEIGRVTLNSNGITLAKDQSFCDRLAELGVYVILSFNTFSSESSIRIHGTDLVETKLKAIDNLKKAGVRMTLLNVLIQDENEDQLPKLIDLIRNNDHILSLTIQTMTYTGQGGGNFQRSRHIPVDVATQLLCNGIEGEIKPGDFISRPSAHPLCYSLCYLFKLDTLFLPFSNVLSTAEQHDMLKDSYLLRVKDDQDFFTDIVNRLYAQNRTDILPVFKQFVKEIFPAGKPLSLSERREKTESAVRIICIHSHMDEDTFDCSRTVLCPDQVPCEDGKLIPACTYNLFYRQQDENFYVST